MGNSGGSTSLPARGGSGLPRPRPPLVDANDHDAAQGMDRDRTYHRLVSGPHRGGKSVVLGQRQADEKHGSLSGKFDIILHPNMAYLPTDDSAIPREAWENCPERISPE